MKPGMTITYEYGGNLYVNTTNRCDLACSFCLRRNGVSDGSIYTDNLWLEREPDREEILASIEGWDLTKYAQLVFCGFGEPSYRLEDICWVIDRLRENHDGLFIRMDTNGTSDLIHGRPTAQDFAGRFDKVSISLNAPAAARYDELCLPVHKGAYEVMKAFAKEVQKYVPQVMMTVVDVIAPEEIEACRRICEEEIGAEFRVREYIAD